MIKSSDLSWIVVSDFKKARRFFVEDLGLQEFACVEEFGWAEMACKEGGQRIGVAVSTPQENMPAGANAVITFTVDDIEKTREDFKKKKINLIGEIMEIPGHCKLQLFSDSDGNKFQLYQNTEQK